MEKLITGEIHLTIDILIGLLLGEIILRLKVADMLLRRIMPFLQRHNIPPVTCISLAVSAGSPKAGAGLLSRSLEQGEISESCALWSILMLQYPAYLRRWPGTFALCVSVAGKAGFFFGLSLIFSASVRFLIAFAMLKRVKASSQGWEYEAAALKPTMRLAKRLLKTMPIAWLFFAVAYSLVPVVNKFFQTVFAGSDGILPLSGWAVAAGSIAHISAALALAGGGLASGELSVSECVFALILGNCLGTITRILRKNAGYYFGLFPMRTAQKMLALNFLTIILPIIICLIFAGIALSLTS